MKRNIAYYTTRLCILILVVFLLTYVLRISARVYAKVTGNTNKVVQLILFDRNDLSNNKSKIGESFNWTDFYPFGESYQTDEPIKLADRAYINKLQENEKKLTQKQEKFFQMGR